MGSTSQKRVLIITYYWPPAGGVAVQRWLKFVKYLPNYGWEPVIYTPENPEFFYEDKSLLKDIPEKAKVIKRPIWEPYNIYKSLTGKKGENLGLGFANNEKSKNGALNKLFIWLRGNLLIPDPRIFWVRPSVKFLCNYLKENPVDAIITTGPPHSMHLIGLKIKKRCNIPWIADFRDPWTNIDFYKELKLTRLADNIHHRLEQKVLKSSNQVIVVSKQMKREFEELGCKNISVITNGFDFEDIPTMLAPNNNNFTICYVGTMNSARNPLTLWQALRLICSNDKEFASKLKIKIAGQIDSSVIDAIKNNNLEKHFEYLGTVPHNKALELQMSSQVLLLVVNNTPNAKGIVTGKFFEYLAMGKQILAVGPTDGDLAEILQETNAGNIVDFNDFDGIKQLILKYYNLYKSGESNTVKKASDKYSRKELTGKLAKILNEITENE